MLVDDDRDVERAHPLYEEDELLVCQDSGLGFCDDLARAQERLELAQRQVDRPVSNA